MTRKTKRKLVLVVVLLLTLALLTAWYVNFRATKSININFARPTGEAILAPQYLYSFKGEGKKQLAYPVAVLVDGNHVYVTDTDVGEVFEFTPEGKLVKTFGAENLDTPLYLAKNPKDGNLYISDRRLRKVQVFTPEGKYVREFKPNLPEEALPIKSARVKGIDWIPVALDFGKDGTLYVTDLYAGHRLLIFGPDGKFKKAVGKFGMVTKATDAAEVFQFPNGVKVMGKEVWVVDSNNRRIQIYNPEGQFLRFVPTSGLPRGIAVLPKKGAKASDETTGKVIVVDTLAHDATIWSSKGEQLANFGGNGVLDGQFQFPNSVSVGAKNLVFLTDSGNVRVQVWGWPEDVSPIPTIPVPQYWAWCLAPLLLLPLLLLLRKRKFLASREFVEGMIEVELLDAMPDKRRKWFVLPETYEVFRGVTQGGVDLGDLFTEIEHSESDAVALKDRLEIDYGTAVILSVARRVKVFCTDDEELRRLAKLLEIETVNRAEYLERYAKIAEKPVEEAS